MGGGNSRQQTWAPQDMQQNPEKIERLTHLLSLKAEHDQTVATRGWDRSQQEMVLLVIIKLLWLNSLVVLDFTALTDTTSVWVELSLREKEKTRELIDEKKMPKQPHQHLLQAQ